MMTRPADCAWACFNSPDRRAAWADTTAGEGLLRLSDQLAAEACGSRSKRAVFMPRRSAATARWMATVVLPAPPFWLIMAMVFMLARCIIVLIAGHTHKHENNQPRTIGEGRAITPALQRGTHLDPIP